MYAVAGGFFLTEIMQYVTSLEQRLGMSTSSYLRINLTRRGLRSYFQCMWETATAHVETAQNQIDM